MTLLQWPGFPDDRDPDNSTFYTGYGTFLPGDIKDFHDDDVEMAKKAGFVEPKKKDLTADAKAGVTAAASRGAVDVAAEASAAAGQKKGS